MVFAMPPFGFWPILLPSYGSLYLLVIFSPGPMRAFALTWAFAFGFFLVGLSWIANALLVEGNSFRWVWPFAIAGLPVLLALFPAALAAIFRKLSSSPGATSSFFLFVTLLGIAEWLRGHMFTGFPWNLPAYAWIHTQPMVQFASVAGSYGLSLVTIFLAMAPAFLLWGSAHRRERIAVALSAIVLFTGLLTYGVVRIGTMERTPTPKPVSVQLVQPGIPQAEKWDSGRVWNNFVKTTALSGPPPEVFERGTVHLVVWPETAVTQRLLGDQQAARLLMDALSAHGTKTYLLAGILRTTSGGDEVRYHNSLQAYDSSLSPLWAYDKSHLVPFGEYIPFQKFFPFGPFARFSGFVPGSGPESLTVDGLIVSPIVCYEVIFPGRVVSRKGPRPHVIVNVTNDAWYGDTIGPRQHFAMAVFRAVEEGIPVMRVANTGISGIIGPLGEVVTFKALDSYGSVVLDSLPERTARPTNYARMGDGIFGVTVLATMTLVFVFRRKGSGAVSEK